MRYLIFVIVACACLVAGCAGPDMILETGPAPDAGLPMGDGGPMLGDAGPQVDGGVTVFDADGGVSGEDASVPGADAAMDDAGSSVPTCGNAVIDPGEACDPGHFETMPDGTIYVVISGSDLAFCPTDCGAIACPGGAVVNSHYCVYYDAPPASGGRQMRLSWQNPDELSVQAQAIRSLVPTGAMALTAMHGGPHVYFWELPYWQATHIAAWRDDGTVGADIPWRYLPPPATTDTRSTDCDGLGTGSSWDVALTVGASPSSRSTVACVPSGTSSHAFTMVFPINVR